jgi:hypothetical protein
MYVKHILICVSHDLRYDGIGFDGLLSLKKKIRRNKEKGKKILEICK